MALSNFERLVKLAEDVFNTKSDPDQLDVNQHVVERLLELHPATVSQFDDGNGPVAWVLLIPTTTALMNLFLEKKISERELFERTRPQTTYEAVYLCSALVLEEYRRQGIARKLLLDALAKIRSVHPVKALFVWPFSDEGASAAAAVASFVSLPLLKRPE